MIADNVGLIVNIFPNISMLDGFGHTQRKILAGLLKTRDGMTIDDFVRELDISRTAINQHINALEKDGYLKRHTLVKTKGRPGQIYVLSKKGINLFPKQYAWFSELLLSNLKEQLGGVGFEKVLSGLGEKIAATYEDQLSRKSSSEKIVEIAAIMQEIGYETNANTGEKDEITACNCVYHDLAIEVPEVCIFDLSLISAMSNRHVKHMACMARGGRECRFKISENLQPGVTSAYQAFKEKPPEI